MKNTSYIKIILSGSKELIKQRQKCHRILDLCKPEIWDNFCNIARDIDAKYQVQIIILIVYPTILEIHRVVSTTLFPDFDHYSNCISHVGI